MVAKCSIGEIGEILGVKPEAIQGLRIQASGVVEVTCKKAEDREAVMRAVSQDKVHSMRKKESWTGVIVYGIDRKWQEGPGALMKELGERIEEPNEASWRNHPHGW